MRLLLYFSIFIFATCSGPKKATTGDTTSESMGQEAIRQTPRAPTESTALQSKNQDSLPDLSFVAGDTYSTIEIAETLIINNPKALQKFYSRVNRTRKPGLPVPDIDFSKAIAIVRCSGISNDDSLPKLYVLELKADEIILGIKASAKKSTSSAVTTPFAVYKIPLTEKEISMQE